VRQVTSSVTPCRYDLLTRVLVDAIYGVWHTLSMEKTTVYVDQQMKRELEALAKRVGRPQAELLREALEEYLERQKRPSLPSFVATSAVGGDASVDVRSLREDRELSASG
jgi:predicted DNA-binding protein